jgi:cobalt-zinc-cadmium efflux system membrane fusion protein
MDGYVAKQNVVLGDSVDLSKQLFRIHSHKKLWVVAFVPITEINLFKKGKDVKIISPLGTTTGVVDFISHRVDIKTKRSEVRIIADNTGELLKPNMFVDVVLSKKLPEALYIPVSAVVFNEGKTIAFVEENGFFYPVEISIGKRIGDYYQLISGLKEGQNVVVKGTVHLKAKFFGEAEEE